MKKRCLMALLLSTVLVALLMSGCNKNSDVAKGKNSLPLVRVAIQPAYHALPAWMAIQKGWSKEAGIDADYKLYNAGGPQVQALAEKQWDIGIMGAAPALLAALNYDSYIIAVSNDESETNDLWVRPDDPILKRKGVNSTFPNIFGSPEDYKGKVILTTAMSTGHFATLATLKALEVDTSAVKLVNTDQAQAMKFFEAGQGDIVQLWAPASYLAEQKGWVKISSGKAAGAKVLGLVVVDKTFADKHPELVTKWLGLYMRGIHEMKENREESEKYLYDFFNNEANMKITKEMVQKEFQLRPVLETDEQLKMFTIKSKGDSPLLSNLEQLASFFEEQGRITPLDKNRLEEKQFNVRAEFLKNLQKNNSKY